MSKRFHAGIEFGTSNHLLGDIPDRSNLTEEELKQKLTERKLHRARTMAEWFIQKMDERFNEISKEQAINSGKYEPGQPWKEKFIPHEAIMGDMSTSNVNFKNLVTKLVNKKDYFITSFQFIKDKETGKYVPGSQDLDSRTCLLILQQSGFKNLKGRNDITPVRPGKALSGGMNVDTGGIYGVFFDPETGTLIIDHHGPHAPNDTSASEMLFEMLEALDFIPITDEYGKPVLEPLRMLVNYITKEDNKSEPREFEQFNNSYRTVAQLTRQMDAAKLLNTFRKLHELNIDPYTPLDDDQLSRLGLLEKSKTQKKDIVDPSLRAVENLTQAGFFIVSPKFGRILIDPVPEGSFNGLVPAGYSAARFSKSDKFEAYDTYLKLDIPNKGFFISSTKPIFPEGTTPPFGVQVRKYMWLKPKNMEGEFDPSEIVKILSSGTPHLSPNLQNYLSKGIIPNELTQKPQSKEVYKSEPASSFNNPFAKLKL